MLNISICLKFNYKYVYNIFTFRVIQAITCSFL